MINKNRQIENAYNIMQYLYDELRAKRFKDFSTENIESLDTLYTSLIIKWCNTIAKEGLYKEYVEHENEELTSVRGQINVQETLLQNSRLRGALICSYDEFSSNVYINIILKSMLHYLIYHGYCNEDNKKEMTKTLQMFNGIDYLDIRDIHWRNIRYNNNNTRYKHLIEICKALLDEHRMEKTVGLDDNRRIYLLFKKQVSKYFKLKYGDVLNTEILEIPYNYDIEHPFETYITKAQRIVVLKSGDEVVLIEIRLKDDDTIQDTTIIRQRLFNFTKLLKTYKKEYKLNTRGVIIHVNINSNHMSLEHLKTNNVNGVLVGEVTIDMHDQWRFITNKLDSIVQYMFKGLNIKKTLQ